MSQTPAEVTTKAFHLVVQRSDGAGFASTSHDRRQHIGSMTLEPDVDLVPGEMVLSDQMFGSKLELAGGLSSPSLSEADLLAGRWSGASVRLLAGDWAQEADEVQVCAGELGSMRIDKGRLSMSVDVLPSATRNPPCIQTSPECRAILGDADCRVDMRSRRKRLRVTALVSGGIIVDETDTQRFTMGRVRWISGKNSGMEQIIIGTDGAKLSLQDAAKWLASVGDVAVVVEGCDGRRATCSERFGNIMNFRGEPDLPGSEILLRFPGA
jgi:uncharacterized phage protein (TIGR02218 family)